MPETPSKTKKQIHFENGQTWDHEIISNALRSRNRAWIVTAACMVIAVLSLVTLLFLLPLKTFEPYVIAVDKNTGYTEVVKGLKAGNLTQDQAVTEANLVKYVSMREQYNPAILKQNYEAIVMMSTKDAQEEYQQLWAGKNPDNPSIKYGEKTSIDIKIKSVSFIDDKTASIAFIREQRTNDQIIIGHYQAILVFQYSQKPMRMRERFSNPLGFQVTHYRVNPVVLEAIR